MLIANQELLKQHFNKLMLHQSGNIFDGTDWAQRKSGQPFFAQVQIFYPHRPFVHDPENPVNPERVHLPDCYPNIPLLRADWVMVVTSNMNNY